jgi:hypothetical protein
MILLKINHEILIAAAVVDVRVAERLRTSLTRSHFDVGVAIAFT